MFDSRGEKLCDKAMDFLIWPLDQAEKRLPRGPLRFFGTVLVFPTMFVLLPFAFPILVAGMVLQYWDHCHK